MGVTYVRVRVASPAAPDAGEQVDCLVDSGAMYSVIPSGVLDRLGVSSHSTRTFILANGEKVERRMGSAAFEYQGRRGDSLVIFGETGDYALLGATTLEGFGLILDPFRRELKALPMLLA